MATHFRDLYAEYHVARRRSRKVFFSSTLSMGLVLFFLGIFACISLFGKKFSEYAKESIAMKVFLYDGLSEGQLDRFKNTLNGAHYIRTFNYVSKEEAASIMLQKTGEDVIQLMDSTNPLLASFNVFLRSNYIHSDSLKQIEENLREDVIVADVVYPVEMFSFLSRNVKILGVITVLVGIIVLLIVFYLILGTIRLSI